MNRNVLKEVLKGLTLRGFDGESLVVMPKGFYMGRFSEEFGFNLNIIDPIGDESPVCSVRVFLGRKPHYTGWIEIYDVRDRVLVGDKSIYFIDSWLEDGLLSIFSKVVEPGEAIYIDYSYDKRTMIMLERGYPPICTRLGKKLFYLGFTWFKVWYFPEGFMEGGVKLQCEKPLDNDVRRRHMEWLKREAMDFISSSGVDDEIHLEATEYARAFLGL